MSDTPAPTPAPEPAKTTGGKPSAEAVKAFADKVKSNSHSLHTDFGTTEVGDRLLRHDFGAFHVDKIGERLAAQGADKTAIGNELHAELDKLATRAHTAGDEIARLHASAVDKLNLAQKAGHLTGEQVAAHREILDKQLKEISERRAGLVKDVEAAAGRVAKITDVAAGDATKGILQKASAAIESVAYKADQGWFSRRKDDIATTFKTTDGKLGKFGRVLGTGAGLFVVYDGAKRALRGIGLVSPKMDPETGKEIPAGFGSVAGGLVEVAAGGVGVYYATMNKGRNIHLGR